MLIGFLDGLQRVAKEAFRVAAQTVNEQFIFAKMPPHLNKSINPDQLQNGNHEKIVSHLEWGLEFNGLEIPDEFQMNTVTQHDTKPSA